MTGVKLTGYPRIYPRIKIRCPTTTRHSTRCGTLHTLKVCPCSVHLAQGKQWRAGNKLKISWKNLFSRWKNAMALSTVKKNKAGWRPRMVREVSILDRDAAEASRRRGHLSCPPQSCPESLKPLPTPDPPPGPEAQVPAARSQPGPHDFFDCSRCEGRSKPSAPGDTRGSLSRPAATLGQAGWILSWDVGNSGCARARPPRPGSSARGARTRSRQSGGARPSPVQPEGPGRVQRDATRLGPQSRQRQAERLASPGGRGGRGQRHVLRRPGRGREDPRAW